MEMKFRQTIYIFKRVTPSKKYTSFGFIKLTWDEAHLQFFNENEIVKIEGNYYVYSGETYNDSNKKLDSLIIFQHRQKVIKTIVI